MADGRSRESTSTIRRRYSTGWSRTIVLPDVNVLIYAHRSEAPDHLRYRGWLEGVLGSNQAFGLYDLVLSAFLRVVTHPRIFAIPTPVDVGLAFIDEVRSRPNRVSIRPGPRHWAIFSELCLASGAKGNIVADAWLAAVAIESGSEWITTDRDFARFPGLRWRHPIEG